MRAWISIVSLAALLGVGGCSVISAPVPPGKPVSDVYGGASVSSPPGASLRIESVPPPGQAERTRPVIYPPKVFAVWVPEHLDEARDFKIGSHYVYMKLRDSSWTEQPIDREPFAKEPVDPSDLALLKVRVGLDRVGRILVPYQGSARETEAARAPQGGRP
jgi:hypothetical protein